MAGPGPLRWRPGGLSHRTWLRAPPSQLRGAAKSLGASVLDSWGPVRSSASFHPWAVPAAQGPEETQGQAFGCEIQGSWPGSGLWEACFRAERTLGRGLSTPAALWPAPWTAGGDASAVTWPHAGGVGGGWHGDSRGCTFSEAWSGLGSDLESAPELSASGGTFCLGSADGGPVQWVMRAEALRR